MSDATPDLDRLRYPIGRFHPPAVPLSPETRQRLIDEIAAATAALREAVEGLSEAELDTPYRPGGWTVRQVVHHVPDSHLNSYVRFKLATTEDHPTIRTYEEGAWTGWLRTLGTDDWTRTLEHPEIGTLTLDQLLALYAWHGRHHVAHITSLREPSPA